MRMKKALLSLLIILIVFLVSSCTSTVKKNLGSDYYLMGEKDNPPSIRLVRGVNNTYDDVILGEIVDFESSQKFILIHRKITDKAKLIFEDNPLWKKQLRGLDQYWIIERNVDGIVGPLDYNEYLIQRKTLEISEGVKLRN